MKNKNHAYKIRAAKTSRNIFMTISSPQVTMETTLLALIFFKGIISALALYVFVEKHNSCDMFQSRF